MKIALSVLHLNKSFFFIFDDWERVVVEDDESSEYYIPNLPRSIVIQYENKTFNVSYSIGQQKKQVNIPFNKMAVLESFEKTALYFTQYDSSTKSIYIPPNSIIDIGRGANLLDCGKYVDVSIDLPFVSRHHIRIERKKDDVYVFDPGSKNGFYVNGEKSLGAEISNGDVISILTMRITYIDSAIIIENAGNTISCLNSELNNFDDRKIFHPVNIGENSFFHKRSPRLFQRIDREPINIEKPPQSAGKPQMNWLTILLTPIVSVLLMITLVFFMGLSPVMLAMSGTMAVLSAILAAMNYKKQKKQNTRIDIEIDQKYHEYLNNIKNTLSIAHNKQRERLYESNPSPRECVSTVQNRKNTLWNRVPEDDDFLSVRIGVGTIDSDKTARFQRAQFVLNENPLEKDAATIADSSLTIDNAPVLSNFYTHKITGIAGERYSEIQLVRNIISEIASFHSYDEVKIIALIPEAEQPQWSWMRWLPHCQNDERTKRFIHTSKESAEETLNEIEETLARRKSTASDFRGMDRETMIPHYVFVVAAFPWIEKHSIKNYIFSENTLGCSAIFVYDKLSVFPKECQQVIEVADGKGFQYDSQSSTEKHEFVLDDFDLVEADVFARAMSPLITETKQGEASIPRSITFLEGYGISKPEELNLSARWSNAQTYKSLSVPIAAYGGGEKFCFDIHEKKHGVNGIVAGMPGSGKTEMVQSWLLSIASNYSPQDVSFVLIDFKGTGMIAPFRGIPHLAGFISNLDTIIDRNLAALQSEVNRREALIDKYSNQSIKNINDLNKAYKQGLVPEYLPILLIVIDEYAEFKKIFPDFGVEIDSLTSKGRALGMFVVLMTQKPAGVVSAKSEDNIKFRWCLRVANYAASQEMLGKPDAANITIPGRAFVKVGENDLYEQVQSFWSGAPYHPMSQNDDYSIPISRVDLNGKRFVLEEKNNTAKINDSTETEIDVVVKHITEYCKQNNVPFAEKVWTEKLPERIALNDIITGNCGFDGSNWREWKYTGPVIGLVDDPSNSRQFPLEIDFPKQGHLSIYGAPVTGKTTLLQTLITSLAYAKSPEETNIYIMDFGGWNLSLFRDLPHVGGIVHDDDPEKIKKLLMLIDDIMQERKMKFSSQNVGNINAYRVASGEKIPDIYVIIDNFPNMLKMYPDYDSFFINLTGSGAAYGIYLIASASSSNSIPVKIAQNIKNVIALQMIDKSDYMFLVGRTSMQLPDIAGRGFLKGSSPLEFQTAIPVRGNNDVEVSETIRATVLKMKGAWSGELPRPIPQMPETIEYGSIKTNKIALGLSLNKVVPVVYDCDSQHYVFISGTPGSGKTNMLKNIAVQLRDKHEGNLYVFDVNGSSRSFLSEDADVYLTDVDEIDSFIDGLRPELQSRQAEKQENPSARFDPIIIAVDDYGDFYTGVSNDTVSRLFAIVKIGVGLGLYLVVADDSMSAASHFSKGVPLTLALVKGKQSVLLGGCMNDHAAIQTKASYSERSVQLNDYEGYFINNQDAIAFRTMKAEG